MATMAVDVLVVSGVVACAVVLLVLKSAWLTCASWTAFSRWIAAPPGSRRVEPLRAPVPKPNQRHDLRTHTSDNTIALLQLPELKRNLAARHQILKAPVQREKARRGSHIHPTIVRIHLANVGDRFDDHPSRAVWAPTHEADVQPHLLEANVICEHGLVRTVLRGLSKKTNYDAPDLLLAPLGATWPALAFDRAHQKMSDLLELTSTLTTEANPSKSALRDVCVVVGGFW
eukprot:8345906-Pyramimonas_sp.AAC.1